MGGATQADRDRAAAYYYSAGGSPNIRDAIKRGEKDDWFRVQAFAHHAEQARLEERERIAALIERKADAAIDGEANTGSHFERAVRNMWRSGARTALAAAVAAIRKGEAE